MGFFFFGVLRDLDILRLVIGRAAPGQPFPGARLADARLVRVRGETFPMLVSAPGQHVPGVIVEGLAETDVQRIRFYESVEYEPITLVVERPGGERTEAQAFTATARARPDQEPWRFEDWLVRHKAKDMREAAIWMSFYGYLDAHEADLLWDRARAEGRSLEELVREICRSPERLRS